MLATLCLTSGLVSAHDNSRSRSLLVLERGRLSHFVKLQVQSVWEVLPLDADGNRFVDDDELAAVQEQLLRYVGEHVALRPDGGEPLSGSLVAAEVLTDDRDALSFQQWIELELAYELPVQPRRLEIEVSLFLETSPRHQDLCDVVWADESGAVTATPSHLRFWAGDPRQVADSGRPPPQPSLGVALWTGARDLAWTPLVLLCLAVLLGGGPRHGRVIAAFAAGLAGSVALGGVLALRVTPGAVGLAGGLALVWVGLLNLTRAGARPVWAEALVFGMAMGLAGPGGPGRARVTADLAPAPPWTLAGGAVLAVLLAGGLLAAVLQRPRWGAALRARLSATAVLAGGWVAWSALASG